MELTVQIVRFVDEHQPGWMECEFRDADGLKHKIVDKVPYFTANRLDRSSAFPQSVLAVARKALLSGSGSFAFDARNELLAPLLPQ